MYLTPKSRFMKHFIVPAGRTLAILFLMGWGSFGCMKNTPALRQADSTGLQNEGRKAVEKSTRRICDRHGAPLETCGVFEFPIDSTLNGGTIVTTFLGLRSFGDYNLAEFYYSRGPFGGFTVCNLRAYILNWNFYVTGSIYDLKGNLVFEVQDNHWKVYRDAVRKFNYDSKGFEAYSKDGRIAISIDLNARSIASLWVRALVPCSSTTLGYFPDAEYFNNFPYGTPESDSVLNNLMIQYPISPMFRYTGRDWQHARL